jgi:tRNA-dihydrouridine synthase 2
MIGTTRSVNTRTGCIEWSRTTHNPQSANADKENTIYRIHPAVESSKLVFQIGTSDPERAVACARLVAPYVAGIDVNAGCPKPFSTSGGMGAALLKTPDKLCAILEALVREITPEFEVGISVKIRILQTAQETEALVRRLVATGITGLTVHCRTTPMRPRERAIRGQLKMIADVCREAGVACLMNGDVENRDQATRLVEEFGVNGAMIATAAEKNPSCFRTQTDGGMAHWKEVVERYMDNALSVGNRFGNTKFLLTQLIPGKSPEYRAAQGCKDNTSVCAALGLDRLLDRARDLDEEHGLTPEAREAKEVAKQEVRAANKAKAKAAKNATALAAGGKMVEARRASNSNRKSLSERGVSLIPDVPAQQPSHAPLSM